MDVVVEMGATAMLHDRAGSNDNAGDCRLCSVSARSRLDTLAEETVRKLAASRRRGAETGYLQRRFISMSLTDDHVR